MPELVALNLPPVRASWMPSGAPGTRGTRCSPSTTDWRGRWSNGLVRVLAPGVVVDADGVHRRAGGSDRARRRVGRHERHDGSPKGVVLTMTRPSVGRGDVGPPGRRPGRDRWLACLPLPHRRLSVVTSRWYRHPCTVSAVRRARSRRQARLGASWSRWSPTALRRTDVAAYRAGAPVGRPPDVADSQCRAPTYGMTETARDRLRREADRRAEVRIRLDAEGRASLRNTGEVLVRGHAAPGYRDGTIPLVGGWYPTR